MIHLIPLFLISLFGCAHAATPSSEPPELPSGAVIWDVKSESIVEPKIFVRHITRMDQLVVGEVHSDEEAQRTEAWILERFINGRPEEVTFAWEFLNWSDRASIQEAYTQWSLGSLSDDDFLGRLFGKPGAQATYLHPLRVARTNQLRILPVNLSREEKKPVVEGGITALDPALLPEGYKTGSPEYFERFDEAMSEHAEPDEIERYFDAQCLTDEVIADHLFRDRKTARSMLVIGNFHSAYFDGVWNSLERRDWKIRRLLVHLEKPEKPLSAEEQKALLNSEKYGPIADYVIFL